MSATIMSKIMTWENASVRNYSTKTILYTIMNMKIKGVIWRNIGIYVLISFFIDIFGLHHIKILENYWHFKILLLQYL